VIPYRADDADDPTSALPIVTIALIVANFLVFFYELSLSTQGSQLDSFIQSYSLVPCEYTVRCTPSGTPSPLWITLFTSMFLHAGWAHILGNMVYLLCGLGADALEIAASASSSLPGLGASGAISGVLAGYVVLYPGSHVRTLIPLGFFFFTARIPAWVFIGVWFAMQLIYGAASISQVNAGGVAYSAHVGGFLSGLLLVRLFAQAHRVDRLRIYHQAR